MSNKYTQKEKEDEESGLYTQRKRKLKNLVFLLPRSIWIHYKIICFI